MLSFIYLQIPLYLIYEPAKGVPNMPTANSAQMRKNINNTIPQMSSRHLVLFTFFKTISHNSTIPNNNAAILMKSVMFQFTSCVNCIAINGIVNNRPAIANRNINLLFFITQFFLRYIDLVFCDETLSKLIINMNICLFIIIKKHRERNRLIYFHF